MHGNVSEWCEDLYEADFYREATVVRDPLCGNSGSGYRVHRGGSCLHFSRLCSSAFRLANSLGMRSSHPVGFRPAWSSP